MKCIFLTLISISLAACFTSKVATETTMNLDKVVAKYPGYTSEMFESGKNLYESNCQSCHGLKDPLKYTEEQWNNLVPVMSEKANDKKGANLTKDDEVLILKYVVAMGL